MSSLTRKAAGFSGAALAAGLGIAAMAAPAGAATPGTATVTDGTAAKVALAPGVKYSRQVTFSLKLPGGAACSGDSATGGYRVSSYIVPGSTDLTTLTFTNDGPVVGNPLYDSTGSAYVEKNTAVSTGVVPEPPAFVFGDPVGFSTAELPPGTYSVGIVCKLGNTVDKLWNASLKLEAAPDDNGTASGGSGAFTYAVPAAVVTPTPAVPEVPLGVLLPLSAAGLIGGGAFVVRRRKAA